MIPGLCILADETTRESVSSVHTASVILIFGMQLH